MGGIYPNHYGFRKKHFSSHALLDTLSSCYDAISEKNSSLIMINLRKAFDTVYHKKLLKKLDHYGIRGVPNQLLASDLKNRNNLFRLKESIYQMLKLAYHKVRSLSAVACNLC